MKTLFFSNARKLAALILTVAMIPVIAATIGFSVTGCANPTNGGGGNPYVPPSGRSDLVYLDGNWHFKEYRKYSNMYQYFPYAMVTITSEDLDLALLPNRAKFE